MSQYSMLKDNRTVYYDNVMYIILQKSHKNVIVCHKYIKDAFLKSHSMVCHEMSSKNLSVVWHKNYTLWVMEQKKPQELLIIFYWKLDRHNPLSTFVQ